MTEMAELFGFSRQNMRKLVQRHTEDFPLPVHEGQQSLWHLAEVLDWFTNQQRRPPDSALQEVARVGMTVNVRQQAERLTPL
jgi:predicted DNA-binding transcriptional regulator AlpA